MAFCGCPPGYTLLPNGDCEKITTVPAIPATLNVPMYNCNNNQYAGQDGAVIYEDITNKQWPLITTPQPSSVLSTTPPTFNTNSAFPTSGINPNPFLLSGPSYSNVSPAFYLGKHDRVTTPVPSGWGPYTTQVNGFPIRESNILSGTLYYGQGNPLLPTNFGGSFNTPVWRNLFNTNGITFGKGPAPGCANNSNYNQFTKQWLGFTQCINIEETKTYYIAACANNAFRFKINNYLAVEVNVGDGVGLSLGVVNIFPVTLPAGTHIFTVEYLNYSNDDGVLFEIYNTTINYLSTVNNLISLNNVTLFSTKDKVGQYFDTSTYDVEGVTIAPTCPDGYTYSVCEDGECVKIEYAEQVICNYLLTPCCGDAPTIVIAASNLLPAGDYNGTTVCIDINNPENKCYQVSNSTAEVTQVTPINITAGPFTGLLQCEQCAQSGCPNCPSYYFNLIDCCTEQPVKDEDGNVIQFVWDGSTPVGPPLPTDYTSNIIRQINSPIGELIINKCCRLNSIPQAPNEVYLDWFATVGTVLTSVDCETCVDCRVCYLLTDCRNPTNTIITETDLSLYVGQVITLVDVSETCYIVEIAPPPGCNFCTDCSVAVQVSKPTCWDCNPCYKITECGNITNTFYSDQDLAVYLNTVIRIDGREGCYRVEKGDTCVGPFEYITVTGNKPYTGCAACRGCFKLVNCEDDTDVIKVIDPGLAIYVNQVIVLQLGNKCYKVLEDEFCEGSIATVQIGQTFTDNANGTACEQCIPAPKPPKLTNERPVRPGYIKPKCPNQCETGCSACNNDC